MDRLEIGERLEAILTPYVRIPREVVNASAGASGWVMHENTKLLTELGISSLNMIDILLEVEDAFEIEVEYQEMAKLERFGAAVDLIYEKTAGKRLQQQTQGGPVAPVEA